jgi:DNA-binding transcriptional ArsR family regulator
MRTAHSALLGNDAADLLDRVQEIVCETTRAQMIRALASTRLNVTELSRVLGRTKWTTSRHLRLLRANDLVTSHRQGREVFYTLASGPTVDAALAALDVFERRSRGAR